VYRNWLQSKDDMPPCEGCESLVLLFNNLIKEPLQEVLRSSDILILLDGLDKLENASPSGKNTFSSNKTELEVLLELMVLLPCTKILVTGRSAPELVRILAQSGMLTQLL
jgi:hypothetical protein